MIVKFEWHLINEKKCSHLFPISAIDKNFWELPTKFVYGFDVVSKLTLFCQLFSMKEIRRNSNFNHLWQYLHRNMGCGKRLISPKMRNQKVSLTTRYNQSCKCLPSKAFVICLRPLSLHKLSWKPKVGKHFPFRFPNVWSLIICGYFPQT